MLPRTLLAPLVVLSLCLVQAASDRLGCAYQQPGQYVVGACDAAGSFCSYGCINRECWKQCSDEVTVNGEGKRKCIVTERKWATPTLKPGVVVGRCRNDQECYDLIDFDAKESSACISGDNILYKNGQQTRG